ncbi:hypothetical protein C8Q77DRAFT_349634 [Trametes polyzona]|nr:hypothetical protein C8Q77DRAFT_349634 [Trametes polyzona]
MHVSLGVTSHSLQNPVHLPCAMGGGGGVFEQRSAGSDGDGTRIDPCRPLAQVDFLLGGLCLRLSVTARTPGVRPGCRSCGRRFTLQHAPDTADDWPGLSSSGNGSVLVRFSIGGRRKAPGTGALEVRAGSQTRTAIVPRYAHRIPPRRRFRRRTSCPEQARKRWSMRGLRRSRCGSTGPDGTTFWHLSAHGRLNGGRALYEHMGSHMTCRSTAMARMAGRRAHGSRDGRRKEARSWMAVRTTFAAYRIQGRELARHVRSGGSAGDRYDGVWLCMSASVECERMCM